MSYQNVFINNIDNYSKSSIISVILLYIKICEVIIKLNNLKTVSKAKKKIIKEITLLINNHI